MTRDEWLSLVPTVCMQWLDLDETDVCDWFDLLDDLEGGHVAMALAALGESEMMAPTASAVRREVARQEVIAPAPSGPFLSMAEWAATGYAGMPAGYTADHARQWRANIEAHIDG